MARFKRILLKLSGESLMGKQGYGIDPERLSDYANQIKEIAGMGVQIGIVIGGGNIFRGLSGSQKGFDRVKGDQMGTSSGLSQDEINRMKAEAEQNAENDKKERERVDKLNQADSMIFQTENQLKELGDKIPAQHKPAIEQALQQLKDAHKAGDIAAIDNAINALNTAWQTASQQMYQGAQGAQAGPENPFQGQQQAQQEAPKDDNIQDADFEEVK